MGHRIFSDELPEPTSFCSICGEAIFPIGTTPYYREEHACSQNDKLKLSALSTLSNLLLAALINAEAVIDGTHEEPDRGIARVKRALWQIDLSEDSKIYYLMRTTAELPATEL